MASPFYSAGTISLDVNADPRLVSGSGTAWLTAGVMQGDRLKQAGTSLFALINAVNLEAELTLAEDWPGDEDVSGAEYIIELCSPLRVDPLSVTERQHRLLRQVEILNEGLGRIKVRHFGLTSPAGDEDDGDAVVVAASGATGPFAEKANRVLRKNGSSWDDLYFDLIVIGWEVYDTTARNAYYWSGEVWIPKADVLDVREKLTADRTYYVRADGSDANTGLANSAGGAFQSVQRAIDQITKSIDTAGFNVDIKIADGTYVGSFGAGSPIVGGGILALKGNPAAPANVVLVGVSGQLGAGWASGGFKFTVENVELQNPNGHALYARWGGQIDYDNVRFGTVSGGHVVVSFLGVIRATSDYNIVGGGAYHFHAHNGAIRVQGLSVGVTGTPNFSSSFANANSAGQILSDGTTFSGSATGKKFYIETGGQIYNGLSGVAALAQFPGDVEGEVVTGGNLYNVLLGAPGRNLIYGGDLTTNPWQRGTSFSAPSNGAWLADGWRYGKVGAGVCDILRTEDAPSISQAGILTTHCLHVDVTTADGSVDAGDLQFVGVRPAGIDMMHFGFGKSDARYMMISFWVKSTKTGIFTFAIRNGAGNRTYVGEYTVNASNVWERKIIAIPGDSSGTWNYGTGLGMNLAFCLMSGSDFHTPSPNAWASGSYFASANQVNAFDSDSNSFKIALLKVEPGRNATPYDPMTAAEVLAASRRYLIVADHYVPASAPQNLRSMAMIATPSISGGGTGFDSTGTSKDTLIAYQSSAGVQTLTLSAEV